MMANRREQRAHFAVITNVSGWPIPPLFDRPAFARQEAACSIRQNYCIQFGTYADGTGRFCVAGPRPWKFVGRREDVPCDASGATNTNRGRRRALALSCSSSFTITSRRLTFAIPSFISSSGRRLLTCSDGWQNGDQSHDRRRGR